MAVDAKRLNPGGIEWNMHDTCKILNALANLGRTSFILVGHLLQINDAGATPARWLIYRQIRYISYAMNKIIEYVITEA